MDSPLLPPLIHTLLAVPALPSVLPIPALTQLSSALPIFTLLLPLASGSPDILNSGQLVTEQGKTYFLANLATFGITGGMLSRYGTNGGMAWIKVLCTVTSGLGEGWGKWVEGEIQTGHVDLVTRENSDSEDDDSTPRRAIPPKSKTHVHHPDPLPINIRSKLVLLASSSHLVTLADLLISSTSKAPTTVLVDFASFALSLLNAFRGSPKWESILETLMEGKRAKLLGRRIWREGVRGRWRNSGERAGWDTFAESESASLGIGEWVRVLTRYRSLDVVSLVAYTHVLPLPSHHTRRRILRRIFHDQSLAGRRIARTRGDLARPCILELYERCGFNRIQFRKRSRFRRYKITFDPRRDSRGRTKVGRRCSK